jgi:hypothetical protein
MTGRGKDERRKKKIENRKWRVESRGKSKDCAGDKRTEMFGVVSAPPPTLRNRLVCVERLEGPGRSKGRSRRGGMEKDNEGDEVPGEWRRAVREKEEEEEEEEMKDEMRDEGLRETGEMKRRKVGRGRGRRGRRRA